VDGQIEVKLDRPPFSTLDLRVTTLKDRQGRVLGKLAIWRDISAIKQTEERLRIFLRAVEQNPTAIVITDTNGNIEYVNPQLTRLTGYGLEELRGRTPRVFKSGEMDDRLYADLWKTIQAGQIWEGELINRKKDGQLYWAHQWIAPVLDDRGQVTHYVAMQEDITPRKQFDEQLLSFNARLQEQLTEIETLHAQLREESIRDGLTRLFNRRYMEETLERELSSAGRASSPISVVIIDIDHFKTINDTYGHQAGDTVLQTLGTLLLENTRSGDIACRYGGDEMVVVMPGAAHQAAVARAEEWQALFAKIEFAFGDAQIRLTLSMGVASFPDHAQEPIQLLTAADKALYGAKSNRNQVRLYDPADAAFS
jgi:diguanylate cyclase (GGDEF)-like protein/PAS domain S-box-containing protein